jgi:hypothetical protein
MFAHCHKLCEISGDGGSNFLFPYNPHPPPQECCPFLLCTLSLLPRYFCVTPNILYCDCLFTDHPPRVPERLQGSGHVSLISAFLAGRREGRDTELREREEEGVGARRQEGWVPVAHTCNPNHLGGCEDGGSRPAWANTSQDP